MQRDVTIIRGLKHQRMEPIVKTHAMVMEYAFIPESGKDAIKLSDFRELWQGHHESVLTEDNVYIACFARGGGAAVKYI